MAVDADADTGVEIKGVAGAATSVLKQPAGMPEGLEPGEARLVRALISDFRATLAASVSPFGNKVDHCIVNINKTSKSVADLKKGF
eukprot:861395-Pyramimonas_sp.AAC.1